MSWRGACNISSPHFKKLCHGQSIIVPGKLNHIWLISHFIPPGNTRKRKFFGRGVRGYKMATLTEKMIKLSEKTTWDFAFRITNLMTSCFLYEKKVQFVNLHISAILSTIACQRTVPLTQLVHS